MKIKIKKERACRMCGDAFIPKRAWQVFCSIPCRKKSHGAHLTQIEGRVERLENKVFDQKAA